MSDVQAVAFRGPLGTLRGMFHCPAESGSFPTVVLLHGFTGSHVEEQHLFVQAARFLRDNGFCVLRFDFFGSGDSDGTFDQFTPLTEVDDAVVALDWVSEQKCVDPDRIAVLGLSLGGCVAALLAGQDPRVKAAVFWNAVTLPDRHFSGDIPTEGPFAGVVGGLRIGPDFLPTVAALDITGTLRRYTGPGLVMRGTADTHISQEEAEALCAALDTRGTLHLIEGADHTFRRPDWRQELFQVTSRWLAEHL
jgi:dipeptidyl aminopeptidase/acylaminoacyl peptidase